MPVAPSAKNTATTTPAPTAPPKATPPKAGPTTPTASNGKPAPATPPKAAPANPKPPQAPVATAKAVVYDKVGVKLYVAGDPVINYRAVVQALPQTAELKKLIAESMVPQEPMTAEVAKQYVGWVEETPENKFEQDYLLKDANGHKVRCLNNMTNRPFDEQQAWHVASEVLQGHWQLNGESMIVGEFGSTLDMQHRAVGLVLAAQLWTANPSEYPYWETEPTMECLVVTGISEDNKVVDTINTGKPRSFQDVLARSPRFRQLKGPERRKAIKIVAQALQFVWARTGQSINALTSKRSHADSNEFLDNHPKLSECAIHIAEEDKEGKISRYIVPGTAAGLMYLMSSCKSDPVKYREASVPGDDALDHSLYAEAADFWIHLAVEEKHVKQVLQTLIEISNSKKDGGATRNERIGLLIKAWLCLVTGSKITAKALELEYKQNSNGVSVMINHPTLGGIDMGVAPDVEETIPETDDPNEQEIAERAAAIKAESLAKKKNTKKGKVVLAVVGNEVWVEDDGGIFHGQVTEIYAGPDGQVAKVQDFGGKRKVFEFPLADCSTVDLTEQDDDE